ncbi:MAG: Fe-S cluster assembly protein SufD [Aphanocapsa lilacina HA4352-LM1]|nr:Fe-S cluster assembly protein SufD [Aphanocapsa lilacina HA4352-LM1]
MPRESATPAAIEKSAFVPDFEPFIAARPGEAAAVLASRRTAMERFVQLGVPHRRLENWRHTDLSPLTKNRFTLAAEPTAIDPVQLVPYSLSGARELVFVDGFFSAELSNPGKAQPGLLLGSYAECLPEDALRWAVAPETAEALEALNGAYWQDGAFVDLAADARVEAPIHLLFIATGADLPLAQFVRNRITAGPGSRATIIETYASLGAGVHFTCPVGTVDVGANADLDHYRLGQENAAAFHLATSRVRLGRDARFKSLAFVAGGGLVRHDLLAELAGPSSEATLHGLYLAGGTRHIDHHLWVRHSAPHAASRQIYKGILAGRARAVFNGNVFVASEAAKTDAKQTNRNLLLSDAALVHSNPQLEIYAGDVRCTHGSTVGQLDEEALFYLRSRGLDEAQAKNLLTRAFASDLFEDIRPAALRDRLETLLYTWLSFEAGIAGTAP